MNCFDRLGVVLYCLTAPSGLVPKASLKAELATLNTSCPERCTDKRLYSDALPIGLGLEQLKIRRQHGISFLFAGSFVQRPRLDLHTY